MSMDECFVPLGSNHATSPTMNLNLTEIAYVLDRSGSMTSMTEVAIAGFNEFLQEQLDQPGDANLSLMLFDDEFLTPCVRTPLQEVRKLTTETYVPRGSTALFDAIGQTIDALGKSLAAEPEERRPGKVVVAIFTDGYENASQNYSMAKINEMITHQRNQYGWDFMFLAANQDAIATASQMGIASYMSSEVGNCPSGVQSSYKSVSRKLNSLRKQSMTGVADEDFQKPMESIVREETERGE